jgi:hypothetical protein
MAAPALDTVSNDLDCNDFDRLVSPSSPELCDQIDNDCNGIIDDGVIDDNGECSEPAPTTTAAPSSTPSPAPSSTPALPETPAGSAATSAPPAATQPLDDSAPLSSMVANPAPAISGPANGPVDASEAGSGSDTSGSCGLAEVTSIRASWQAGGPWLLLAVALLWLRRDLVSTRVQ